MGEFIDSLECVNSVFEQPWWLEAVAPGRWGAAEIIKNGEIIARLPYVISRRFGFKLLGMPDYTQTLGYWIEETGAKNSKKFGRHKEILEELINQLPKVSSIDIALDHANNYLFPFRWSGCKIEMSYSYRLENIKDTDMLWNGLADNIRREIKKAQKRLTVKDDCSLDDLIIMQEKTFARQGRYHHDNSKLLRRLDDALLAHNSRKLLCAIDGENRIHAAAYFVYDDNCCYYLIGGGDPELRTSGAASLLMWEGIKFASEVSKAFDFEGSMIEPIERFFRAFGGVPTPYWRVVKLNPVLEIYDYMKPRIKKLIGWK